MSSAAKHVTVAARPAGQYAVARPLWRQWAVRAALGCCGLACTVLNAGAGAVESAAPVWIVTVRQDPPPAPLATPRGQGARVIGSSGASAMPDRPGTRTWGVRGGEQSFRVQEGGSVSIAMEAAVPFTFYTWTESARSTARPLPGSTTRTTSAGAGAAQTLHYNAVLGFDARPVVQGHNVTLHITPQLSTVVPDAAAVAVAPVVQGRVGEWIAIGGADTRDSDLQPHQRGVWLRVEAATQ